MRGVGLAVVEITVAVCKTKMLQRVVAAFNAAGSRHVQRTWPAKTLVDDGRSGKVR